MSVVPGAPSDNTDVQTVLEAFAGDGFADSYEVSEEGAVTHSPSGTQLRPEDLEVVRFRRLEGASDPSDMVLVAGVRSPAGDGVIVVKYGPEATPGEADLLTAWRDELARAQPR